MAKKKVEEMNNGELYKYYKNRAKIAKALKWAFVVIPFIVLFGVKFNEYIEVIDEASKIKMSIGAILAIIVSAIAILKEFRKEEKTKPVAAVVGWGLAFAFSYLFQVITKDLTLILGCEFAGQVIAVGFQYWGDNCALEAADYKKLAREDHTLLGNGKVKKEETKENNVGGSLI